MSSSPAPPPVLSPVHGLYCAAWSRHAAELAVPVAAMLELWEETPSTDRMVADGLLVRLLPGIFMPPDRLGSAVRRALALGCALGPRLRSHHVIAGASAAWVLLGGVPPCPPELISTAHRTMAGGARERYARLPPDQVETIGGAPLTVPVRTAVDLLRFAPEETATELVLRLLAEGHVRARPIALGLQGLDRHRGVPRARERLAHVRELLARCEEAGRDQLAESGSPAPTGLPSAVTR